MRGDLEPMEPHPAAMSAGDYINSLPIEVLSMWQESFSSCAIEGNRLGEICGETLSRIMSGKPVSDRYLIGLAWTLKAGESTWKEVEK